MLRFDDYYPRGDGGGGSNSHKSVSIAPPGQGKACDTNVKITAIETPINFEEPLPDNNPKSAHGVKKAPTLSVIPASAILVEGQVMALGAAKYGKMNWRTGTGISASVYIDALIRHAMDWNAGIDNDPESLVSHLGHIRACAGILIDAQENGFLIDDRPKDEATPRLLKQYERK